MENINDILATPVFKWQLAKIKRIPKTQERAAYLDAIDIVAQDHLDGDCVESSRDLYERVEVLMDDYQPDVMAYW